ncbi:hypothetical protein SCOR_15105 [Sulfidibacter corallicola]|uniref:Holin n=1 Tax=Sulfidibacter corallicola TaxID=2818388 RepID=A0A8A4TYP0_SULCO|nr:hypothetical protein [Sulfidibacter corallicola]QTD54204.1 hypothetical protein J3U87_17295 [Sulfidibacter corallicola]
MNVLDFLQEYQAALISLAVAVIGAVKLTSWGRARAEVLDTLVTIIESLGLKEAKAVMAVQERRLSQGAQDALAHAVSKADPKKKPKPLGQRLLGEALRGIIPKR